MKKTKRFISLLLIIQMMLVCSLIPGVAALDTTETTQIVIETTEELLPMAARGCGYTSVNQMQHLINSGQAPSAVTGVHNGFQGQQPHVHFSDGTAMNFDGSAHHGNPNPSAATMSWLNSHGWCIS